MTAYWSYNNRAISVDFQPSNHTNLTPDDYEFLAPYFEAIKQDSLNRVYDDED